MAKKTYFVSIVVPVEFWTEVEAENENDAKERAGKIDLDDWSMENISKSPSWVCAGKPPNLSFIRRVTEIKTK